MKPLATFLLQNYLFIQVFFRFVHETISVFMIHLANELIIDFQF